MTDFLLWYAVITLLGWISFPICFRLFSRLKDRGFGLSKVIGLLLWAYVFWLLNMLQIGQNTPGGLLLALAIVLVVSWMCLRNGRSRDLLVWVKEHKRTILFIELVFLALFAFWTLVRATNPDVAGTEKPMELAFITSILRSPHFPPHDPWLSGYAISYYYFGYVMAAMIIKITGTVAWVGFNLSSALWFSLTGIAAFSLVYSLISMLGDQNRTEAGRKWWPDLIWALLGPLYLLVVSNVEGFLEMLHARSVFWQAAPDGTMQSKFWSWLDLQELVQPPAAPFSWVPERVTGIWWWRASRVLQDYTALGQSKEIIDEFPFFSYLLADLHPHVLSMPFVILAAAFALNFYLSYSPAQERGTSLLLTLGRWFQGQAVSWRDLTIYPLLTSIDFWVAAFLTGSLAFLNTWDFPIYVGLFAAVYTYKRFLTLGWSWERLLEFITFGILIGIIGILFFLPFYFGFSSQAGGFLPSLFFFTRGVHFWVMFMPLLFPLLWWLISRTQTLFNRSALINGLRFSAIFVGGLWLVSYLLGWLGVLLPVAGNRLQANASLSSGTSLMAQKFVQWGDLFYNLQGISGTADIWNSIKLRIVEPGTWITIFILATLVWGFLSRRARLDEPMKIESGDGSGFILLLVLLGIGLVLFPEFFYLRDQFGWRINTIFKFYFQAWILWGISAAAVSAWLWKSLVGWRKPLFGIIWTAVLFMALAYPWFGLRMKLSGFDLGSITLNGAQHIERYSSDEMQAIEWLVEAPDGVVVEAVGGSYSGFARISTFTGLPTVLGWPGHESQWRGGAEEMGNRENDIRQIYEDTNWDETLLLLQNYEVHYVYIGSFEHNTYRVSEEKFANNLATVFENGTVRVYEVPKIMFSSNEGVAVP